MPRNTLFAYQTLASEKTIFDLGGAPWSGIERTTIDSDWRGRSLLREGNYAWKNLTRVTALWNRKMLFFYFECWFDTLTLDRQKPDDRSASDLWEADVVEMFLKPKSCDDYFEIEVSPLGQWLDAHVLEPRVDVDFHWESRLRLTARIFDQERIWRIIVGLPFEPMLQASQLSRPPRVGESWRLNLYRIAGRGSERDFLAWRPTYTRAPDFHVPASFGNLIFLED